MTQNEKPQWVTPTLVIKPVSETLTQAPPGGEIGIGS